MLYRSLLTAGLLLTCLYFSGLQAVAQIPTNPGSQKDSAREELKIERVARPHEFLTSLGQRAALFGREDGTFEAWVYPLKLLKEFRLTFRAGGREIPGSALVRTLTTYPEASELRLASDTFAVTQTWFVPVDKPGAYLVLDIEAAEPVEIAADFAGDLELMWPAGLGGAWSSWQEETKRLIIGEEQQRFFGVVGSPNITSHSQEFFTRYITGGRHRFELGIARKGRSRKTIVFAGSTKGREEAERAYNELLTQYPQLREQSRQYYANYLGRTAQVTLPDGDLQAGYDWARISTIQGLVTNPLLGTGLVAGYRYSYDDARPGFAWFFGRDSLWTALALNSIGDFATTKTALDFIIQFQRQDGKIPHEIAQSASLVPWFEKFPYGYAAADATPLFIITVNDYVKRSGDVQFAKQHWQSLINAYQFLRSTYDENGWPKNEGIGHGWVEGGPLLPVRSEFYQSGLGTEALRSLAELARAVGEEKLAADLQQEFAAKLPKLNSAFWLAGPKIYAFALDTQNKPVEIASVLSTVPMWWNLLDAEKASSTIDQVAGQDHLTDWGSRILSNKSTLYDPSGYHFGSVWPLFSGWAGVGEYNYHRESAGFANLSANARIGFTQSAGHFTEVLSGDFFEQHSQSSPHQVWSAAMVISPLLRGMMGLSSQDVGYLRFAPHVPAHWNEFSLRNVPFANARVDLDYSRTDDDISLRVRARAPDTSESALTFAPAVSLRAQVMGVEVNGRRLQPKTAPSLHDQHVEIPIPLGAQGEQVVRIRLRNDFGVHVPAPLPRLGERSRNAKLVSETWSADRRQLDVLLDVVPGVPYDFPVRGGAQIASVDGAKLARSGSDAVLNIRLDGQESQGYKRHTVRIRFK